MLRTIDNVTLMRNQVLVERDPSEEKTASGIILSAAAQKPKTTGTVVKAGSQAEFCQVGDTIIFGQWCSQVFPIGDKEYILLKEDPDVLAITNR